MSDKPEGPHKPGTPDMVSEARGFLEQMKALGDKVDGAVAEVRSAVAAVNESYKQGVPVSEGELGSLKPQNPRLGPKL
jgi:hypothetical protein